VSTTTALTKVGSTALSKLTPHFTQWFLKKYFPLDTSKLVIEVGAYPSVNLNYSTQDHDMWFEFELNNFGLYDLELINFQCNIRADSGHDIIQIKESVGYDLKSDKTYRYQTIHPLTPRDAARIKQYVPNSEVALATFQFRFTVRSKLGLQEIYLPDKKFCLRVRQYPSPPNVT
jgi:hypothetical protein